MRQKESGEHPDSNDCSNKNNFTLKIPGSLIKRELNGRYSRDGAGLNRINVDFSKPENHGRALPDIGSGRKKVYEIQNGQRQLSTGRHTTRTPLSFPVENMKIEDGEVKPL